MVCGLRSCCVSFVCFLPWAQIRPGFGLDETFYAWAVSVFNIGELLFALIFAVALKYFRAKSLSVFGLLCIIIGSVIYGSASAGWMVIVGRFLQGAFLGGQATIMRIYFGETSNTAIALKGEDPLKSQIKNTNFVITFGFASIAVAVGPGMHVSTLTVWADLCLYLILFCFVIQCALRS